MPLLKILRIVTPSQEVVPVHNSLSVSAILTYALTKKKTWLEGRQDMSNSSITLCHHEGIVGRSRSPRNQQKSPSAFKGPSTCEVFRSACIGSWFHHHSCTNSSSLPCPALDNVIAQTKKPGTAHCIPEEAQWGHCSHPCSKSSQMSEDAMLCKDESVQGGESEKVLRKSSQNSGFSSPRVGHGRPTSS